MTKVLRTSKEDVYDEKITHAQESPIITGPVTYGPDSPITTGPATYGPNSPIITDASSKTYEGDKINSMIDGILAPILIRKLGVGKTGIMGGILSLTSLFTMFLSLNSFGTEKIFDFLPIIPTNYTSSVIIVSAVFLLIGFLFFSSLSYYYKTKCKKCGRDFALKEIKDPIVRDTETREGLRRTIHRYYKCMYCGVETAKKSKYTIRNEDEPPAKST